MALERGGGTVACLLPLGSMRLPANFQLLLFYVAGVVSDSCNQ